MTGLKVNCHTQYSEGWTGLTQGRPSGPLGMSSGPGPLVVGLGWPQGHKGLARPMDSLAIKPNTEETQKDYCEKKVSCQYKRTALTK